ncbi:MAG: ArgE/DapE family deacylase [Coriobacteriaceae bacterium]|nr:ArgE/DapE family deacylase [Coriobacteriaceae bacterium]MCI6547495.1 ArgE/DapE family deacylase [Coriobacteriaceae bacterium]MCI7439475.1 ArgE/DapE family deacylase [Coriobacteriaceae bacterium]MDD7584247.1 ArgE/DapE family deacylase [Coriobacteriaceae bacterium]
MMTSEECVRILRELVRIDTVNGNERAAAEYLKSVLAEHGIDSTLIPYNDDRASLVAEVSNGSGKTIAISGHLDVVSPGDPSDWSHDPFSGDIEDGVMWGRGTTDMKSGLAALVAALIELKEGGGFSGTVRLIATVGEEVGELGSAQLAREGVMDGVDALLIGEPNNFGVMYAHKGSLNYRLVSKGTAAHASTPDLGSNAIDHLVDAMRLVSERVERAAARASNPVLGSTFHNVTLMRGGVQINSIPDHAEYEANARTIPEYDNAALMNDVRAVVDELNQREGFEISVEVTADQPPVQSNPDSELIQAVIETAQSMESLHPWSIVKSMSEALGEDVSGIIPGITPETVLAPVTASGTTDAAQFLHGRPGVDLAVWGPGLPMLSHKIDERVPVAQYLDFAKAYSMVLRRYLAGVEA